MPTESTRYRTMPPARRGGPEKVIATGDDIFMKDLWEWRKKIQRMKKVVEGRASDDGRVGDSG